MRGYDGSVRIDTRLDAKGFNKGIKSITNSLKGVAAAIGVAFGIGAIVNFGKTAVSAASELAAAMTGLQSVVEGTGGSFATAQKFINDYIQDGLVPATNAINAYKNLTLRGYDTSQIEKVLTALKDSTAFGRQSSLSIGEAVQSASEGLKNENSILVDNAGVTKNVAKMWQDYAEKIGTTTAALTKQQKIQAEVDGIMQETRFQTGDAAKLTGGYAGMVAALSTSFYNLRVALGNVLIPILAQIIPLIKTAIDGLTVLLNRFAQTVSALFGVEMGVASAAKEAADATGDLADNTKAAEKAAKGALASFDDLNVLDEKGDAAATIGVEIPGLMDEGGMISPETEAALDGFRERMMQKLQPLTDALAGLGTALGGLGGTIWDSLKWAWDNILKPMGEWTATEAAPALLDLLADAAGVLNEVLIALQPLGVWLWENFLKPLGEWTGQILLQAIGWLTEKLEALASWISENQTVIQNIVLALGTFWASVMLISGAISLGVKIFLAVKAAIAAVGATLAFLTSPISLVILGIAALIAVIVLLIKNWDWVKETAGKVWDWIVEKWGLLSDWFKDNVTEPLKAKFTELWDGMKEWAKNAWINIQDTWEGVKDWFQEHVTDPVKNFFSSAWEDIKGFFSGAWDKVVEIWGGIGAWITEHVTDPIRTAFEGALDWVKEKWEAIFGGFGDFFKGVVNGIIGFINGMIWGFVEGINTIVGALNSLSITIPEWVPGIGGNAFGVNLPYAYAPQIPYLATGAVIPPNSEFLAMLGDNKSQNEILAPEDTIRRIVEEALEGATQEIKLSMPVYLDSEKIYDGQQRVQIRRGKSLVSGRLAT